MSTASEVLNRFCQLRKTQPEFIFGPMVDGAMSSLTKCIVRVSGCSFESQGIGHNQQDAKTAAVNDYVQLLYANGLMQLPKERKGKGKGKGKDGAATPQKPTGPSWAIQGPPTNLLGPPKKKARHEPKTPGLQSRKATDGEISQLCNQLRAGNTARALELVQQWFKAAPRALSSRHMLNLLGSVGLEAVPEQILEFLDTLDALELPSFPDMAGATYFGRFGRWAIREFMTDGKSSIENAANTPVHILERNGACVTQLQVSPADKANELILSPITGPTPQLLGFQKGDWLLVTFPHTGSVGLGKEGNSVEAELTGIQAPTVPNAGIQVKLIGNHAQGAAEKFAGKTCRIDRAANHVTFSRQIMALQTLCGASSADPLVALDLATGGTGATADKGKGKGKGKGKDKPIDEQPTWLREVLLAADAGLGRHEARLCSLPHGWPSVDEGSALFKQMNGSQKEAVRAAGSQRLTLVQGPPGAGKTTTAILLVRSWVDSGRGPILCAADSNIAVDNLVAGCAAVGVQVVRVGRPEASRADLEQYNLLEIVKQESQGMREDRNLFAAQREKLSKAQVVCTTCSGADHPVLSGFQFSCSLIDEAGQTHELATLVPLMKLKSTGSVVLVGDHRQLPPTVACQEIANEGFSLSLFERLTKQGVAPLLLDIQYRMHPAVAVYPSMQFYNGMLRSGIRASKRPPPQGISWPVQEVPVAFLPVEGQEETEGTSFMNQSEADAVEALLTSALSWRDVEPTEIGIVTPYAAQARLLRRKLGCPPPGKKAPPGACGQALVEVSSVDGFQGREKDLIIVSTVRANQAGTVGFVGDPRRLNVTLTRCRRGLVVCGNLQTLSHDEKGWKPWLSWAHERGLIAGVEASVPEALESIKQLSTLNEEELLGMPGPAGA